MSAKLYQGKLPLCLLFSDWKAGVSAKLYQGKLPLCLLFSDWEAGMSLCLKYDEKAKL